MAYTSVAVIVACALLVPSGLASNHALRQKPTSASGGLPPTISVDVGVEVRIGDAGAPAGASLALVSREVLLPARQKYEASWECYNTGNGKKVLAFEYDVEGLHRLQRDITALLSGDSEGAMKLMREADINGDAGLDVIEYGLLLDLLCWRLHIKIEGVFKDGAGGGSETAGAGDGEWDTGRRFKCDVTGDGFVGFDPYGAHADLEAAFECADKDGDGKLSEGEKQQMVDAIVKALGATINEVRGALQESDWAGDGGYGIWQFDCWLMKLCQKLHRDPRIQID